MERRNLLRAETGATSVPATNRNWDAEFDRLHRLKAANGTEPDTLSPTIAGAGGGSAASLAVTSRVPVLPRSGSALTTPIDTIQLTVAPTVSARR
jgi:hypothetical protein